MQIKSHGYTAAPESIPRFTPTTDMSSIFPHACPSPPSSVDTGSTSSHFSAQQIANPVAASVNPYPVTTTPHLPGNHGEKPTVRFRNRGPPVIHSQPRPNDPSSPTRVSPIPEFPDSESAWGVLFDSHGYSTQRLGQILRSLAAQVVRRQQFLLSCHYPRPNPLTLLS